MARGLLDDVGVEGNTMVVENFVNRVSRLIAEVIMAGEWVLERLNRLAQRLESYANENSTSC
jgi:hypothetical protein